MANYSAIVRCRPEVREFIRNRRWVFRGEAVVYGPDTRCDAFSTDDLGFRHSMFDGKTMSVADCVGSDRYGVMLGSSHLYGFGLAGNENTMPSLLAERFGFPVANMCMPEANSRNLYSLLAATIARSRAKPKFVIFMSGGDFTSFCFTRIADPMFGTPNLKLMRTVTKERGPDTDETIQFRHLLAFNSLWTRSIGVLCRAFQIPLILVSDTTFFEKEVPDQYDKECALGVASNPAQDRQFDTHKRLIGNFCANRARVAEMLGAPLVGPGMRNQLGFVDEFHYDRDASAKLATEIGDAIAPFVG